MNLRAGDELVAARPATDDDDVIMVSEQGMSIRFPASDVTPHSRTAGGVRGMRLRNDRLVSMDIAGPESRILVISKLGYGKVTPISKYRKQGRGGSGIKTFNITKKTGRVAAAQIVDDSSEVYVVSEQAQVLRTSLSEISSMGRITQGVTIFRPAPGDKVSSIACVQDIIEPGNGNGNGAKSTNGKGKGQIPLAGLK